MKRKISGLLFLVGFGILAYPTISDQWNTYRQSRLISSYESAVEEMTPEDFTQEWEAARQFNSTLTQNNIYGDVFASDQEELENTEYWKVLNIGGDGVMGYLFRRGAPDGRWPSGRNRSSHRRGQHPQRSGGASRAAERKTFYRYRPAQQGRYVLHPCTG